MIDGWPVLDKQEKRALVFELNRLVETRHERKAFYDTEGAPTNDSAPSSASIGSKCLISWTSTVVETRF